MAGFGAFDRFGDLGRLIRYCFHAPCGDFPQFRQRPQQQPMAGSNHDRTRRSLFQNVWHKWINDRLVKHAATDTGTRLEIVRLAADGAWLTPVLRPDDLAGSNDMALLQELVDLTGERRARNLRPPSM
jgi:hypothetical protein